MDTLLPKWLTVAGSKIIIDIHVQPGTKRDAIVGEFNGRLKIALNAPPVDGKANASLTKFLSKRLGISKSSITLVSGNTSRDKRIAIISISNTEILAKLLPDPTNK